MRLSILLLGLFAAAPLSAAPRKPRLPAGLLISSILIETHEVFDTSAPPEDKLLYRTANRLHIRTRDPVIERELLFAVGDPYDAALVEETERNLRALSFIRRAEISAAVNAKGGVDVLVRTYDSWTLEVVAGFKRVGGVVSVKAGLAEHNILGQGKAASAVYSRDGGAETKAFAYKDVQFLHYKRLQYSMVALTAPGSQNFTVSLNRPFYASIATRAAGVVVGYTATKTAAGVSRRVGEAGASYGVALATSTERTRRVSFGLLTRRSQSTGAAPDLQQVTFLQLGGDWQELDFLTVRRIQNFTHDEDYNLGLAVLPSVAWAPALRTLGTTESQIVPKLELSKGFTWANQLLLVKSAYAAKHVNGGNGDRTATVDASYFVRGLRYQTWAFHAGLARGWRLGPDALLALGEVNGLRGYGLSEFSGDRRCLFNVEDRVYVYDDLFRILDVGAVAFFDSGYAWPSGVRVKASDLKNSVGLGLRVAPSRSGSNSPVRVDVAFPLSRHDGPKWALSILAGQAF